METLLKIYQKIIDYLVNLPRSYKQFLTISADYLLLVLTFELSLSARINDIYIPTTQTTYFIFIAPLIALPIFYFSGLYKTLLRYSGYKVLVNIILGVSLYTVLWFLIVLASSIVVKPYDFLFINWVTSISAISSLRFVVRWLLIKNYNNYKSVLVYGAGAAGIQLESAMRYSPEVVVEGFLDDDREKQGRSIKGLTVYNPKKVEAILTKKKIKEICIAMPSISKSDRANILRSLKKYPIVIRELPGFTDLVQGRVDIADLRLIKIEDLLNREAIEPNKELLSQDIQNRNILVTGAGGSIGSEICRQAIHQKPKLLILFEINEHALYTIEKELLEINSNVQIMAMLGNITNQDRLEYIIKTYNVHTIYHTAAYKHVSMVEKNILAALSCNIFGTLACIQASIKSNIQSFVSISTDKAVRPTNIMGATKRFSELILQSFAAKVQESQNNPDLRISIVRFGNVLGSSGSVVPLFREQIEKGGPLTVTDPNIIRYFMTISEAAQLVIQAGSMGSNGEIFLLDMGEPIPILQLAKDMIRLSGMSFRDRNNPDGDIEIQFTGLRPGEKLYEELLIDDKAMTTKHKKIMKANDKGITMEQLEAHLSELSEASKQGDYKKIKQVFTNSVEGFKPSN